MKIIMSFAGGFLAGCIVLLYFQGPSLVDAADAPAGEHVQAIKMDPYETVDPEINHRKNNAIGVYTSFKFGWDGQTYGMTPQVGIMYYRRIGNYSIGGGPVFTAEQFGFSISALRHF